jgi:hypothetical protein
MPVVLSWAEETPAAEMPARGSPIEALPQDMLKCY